ncbi:22818_t:CDS:2 [Cetraspora pellucida]|uniref:22818_t:CDS:1 n=1 Tax=Cetraspora pellucida TaxID=1433469 RepID=A0A9N9HRB1_9GLOM|nr:22818_t:CDS:2 [Cetraspora pellucida]
MKHDSNPQQNTSILKDPEQNSNKKFSFTQTRALERTKSALEESLKKFNANFNKHPSKFLNKEVAHVQSCFNRAINNLSDLMCEYISFPKASQIIAEGVVTNFDTLSHIYKEISESLDASRNAQINTSQFSELLTVPKDNEIGSSSDVSKDIKNSLSSQSKELLAMSAVRPNKLVTILRDVEISTSFQPNVMLREDEMSTSQNNKGQKRKFITSDCKDGNDVTFPNKKRRSEKLIIDALKNKRNDLKAIPPINDTLFAAMAIGYYSYNESWEALEYLGDRVIESCLFKVAKSRYLSLYSADDIKTGIMRITTNKILAAYSITLKLHELNNMKFLSVRKFHADAFEAYFGAYFLVYGELLTCTYLDYLMTPLLDLIINHVASGNKTTNDSYNLASEYFSMSWIRNTNFLN